MEMAIVNFFYLCSPPTGTYLFKVNNRNIRTIRQISLKFTLRYHNDVT